MEALRFDDLCVTAPPHPGVPRAIRRLAALFTAHASRHRIAVALASMFVLIGP